MWNDRVICACGLFPFLVYAVRRTSIIAFIVFCNGIWFHIFRREDRIVKLYDIICNILLAWFVNIYANTIMVTRLTMVAGFLFVANSLRSGRGVTKALLQNIFSRIFFVTTTREIMQSISFLVIKLLHTTADLRRGLSACSSGTPTHGAEKEKNQY